MIEKIASDDDLRRILEARALTHWPEIKRAVAQELPLELIRLLMTRNPETEPLTPDEDPWHPTHDKDNT